jgi:hypothetical protein
MSCLGSRYCLARRLTDCQLFVFWRRELDPLKPPGSPLADQTIAFMLCLLRVAQVTATLPVHFRSDAVAARAAHFIQATGVTDAQLGLVLNLARLQSNAISAGPFFVQGLVGFCSIVSLCLSYTILGNQTEPPTTAARLLSQRF